MPDYLGGDQRKVKDKEESDKPIQSQSSWILSSLFRVLSFFAVNSTLTLFLCFWSFTDPNNFVNSYETNVLLLWEYLWLWWTVEGLDDGDIAILKTYVSALIYMLL